MSGCSCNIETITIIGTGSYGLALGRRIAKFGYKIIYGSRNPNIEFIEKNFGPETNISLFKTNEVWEYSSQIVIFAIKPQFYAEAVKELFSKNSNNTNKEKIIIDVSNNDFNINKKLSNGSVSECLSNAEILQNLFNKYSKTNNNFIVKAFNNISAYSMSCEYADRSGNSGINLYDIGQMVPIASDYTIARERVIEFCNQIGFRAFSFGMLKNARQMEKWNDTIFIDWHYPSIFAICYLILTFIWYFFYAYLTNPKYKQFSDYLSAFSILACLNRVFGCCSIILLSIVYLASIVASTYQLCYGTKVRKFPKYLDLWLKSRKHLGLWSFFYASLHVFMSLCLLDLGHFAVWYKRIIVPNMFVNINQTLLTMNNNSMQFSIIQNGNIKMPVLTLHAELNILSGILAFILFCLLAITSINSISSSLNMSEWRFIQSKCGTLCLLCALLHDVIMFSRFLLERKINNYSTRHILTRMKFLILWLPLLTLITRFIFSCFKPISKRIEEIRNGRYDSINKTVSINSNFKKEDECLEL